MSEKYKSKIKSGKEPCGFHYNIWKSLWLRLKFRNRLCCFINCLGYRFLGAKDTLTAFRTDYLNLLSLIYSGASVGFILPFKFEKVGKKLYFASKFQIFGTELLNWMLGPLRMVIMATQIWGSETFIKELQEGVLTVDHIIALDAILATASSFMINVSFLGYSNDILTVFNGILELDTEMTKIVNVRAPSVFSWSETGGKTLISCMFGVIGILMAGQIFIIYEFAAFQNWTIMLKPSDFERFGLFFPEYLTVPVIILCCILDSYSVLFISMKIICMGAHGGAVCVGITHYLRNLERMTKGNVELGFKLYRKIQILMNFINDIYNPWLLPSCSAVGFFMVAVGAYGTVHLGYIYKTGEMTSVLLVLAHTTVIPAVMYTYFSTLEALGKYSQNYIESIEKSMEVQPLRDRRCIAAAAAAMSPIQAKIYFFYKVGENYTADNCQAMMDRAIEMLLTF